MGCVWWLFGFLGRIFGVVCYGCFSSGLVGCCWLVLLCVGVFCWGVVWWSFLFSRCIFFVVVVGSVGRWCCFCVLFGGLLCR